MNYRIVPTMKRGEKVWVVDIAATPETPRQRIFRKTKAEAEQYAIDKFGELKEFSPELSNFTYRERVFLRYWLERMPIEKLEELVKKAAGAKEEIVTVAAAIQSYKAAPRERALSPRHKSDLKSRLQSFEDEFGEQLLTAIDQGELEDYIMRKGMSAPNHYRVLRGLFYYAMRREWLTKNPVKLIRKPVVISGEKQTLSPATMKKALRICAGEEPGILFRTNGEPITQRYDPMLRLLVAGGLCGLRHSEIMRLDCADVDVDLGEIHVQKMKTQAKGIRERFVKPPACALEWLRWLQLPKSGSFIECNERNLKPRRAALVQALELDEWPHNVLRRSFASYHLAAFENADKTAALMGHTDAQTTHSKYRVARRKEIADAWFALTPSAVLTQ